ncbi:MAG TPA: ABC transporter permease [Blastocatellia bacterium]|nr:ABC transporter permease [Blastocatellia bacterium]
METILQDLRYGVRVLAKNRLFTFLTVITLGFGIGANSAIFSAVHAVLMRPLPFENPDELVRIFSYNQAGKIGVTSWKDLQDWQKNAQSFAEIAVYSAGENAVIGPNGPDKLKTADVSASFFDLLGVKPIIGRAFLPEEDGHSGDNRVVILGEGYWRRQFGADPNVLGQLLVIDDYNTRIVGVVPDQFNTLVGPAQMWFAWPAKDEPRDSRHLPVIGRLKAGVSVKQADSEINALSASLTQMYPDTNREVGARVESLKETIIGDINLILMILFAAVGLVLLIACANVANLMLAKAAARAQEIAIRSALGASRKRLLRQILTECLLLATLGGGLALLLASLAIKFLIMMNPGDIPRLNETGVNGSVIAFTVLLSLVSVLIFGLTPALRLSKTDSNGMLKEFGRGIKGSRSSARVRSLLVMTELALSLVVLIGAGLLVRSFYLLISIKPGFNQEQVVTATVSLPNSRYPKPESRKLFYDQLVSRLESLPGTQSAALCTTLPLGGSGISDWWGFVQEGHVYKAEQKTFAQCRRISPGYLQTMQIPLIAGRDFSQADGENAQPVLVVSQTMARKVWPDESPVGKRLVFSANGPPYEVVGLVGDVKRAALDDADDMAFYIPLAQSPARFLVIVARTSATPASLSGPIKSMVAGIDDKLPVANLSTMENFLDTSLAKRRFILLIFSVLGGLALLLAAIGTYGVMSYSVIERTQEIGIRLALGASRRNILLLVTGQAVRLAGIGIVIGLVVAYVSTRLLASYLFKVNPADPVVFAFTAIFLVVVSLVAASLPALRATRVDPMRALRSE